jgi:hypothetical protein
VGRFAVVERFLAGLRAAALVCAWASEPGAMKANTRNAKHVLSERMFFLSSRMIWPKPRCR